MTELDLHTKKTTSSIQKLLSQIHLQALQVFDSIKNNLGKNLSLRPPLLFSLYHEKLLHQIAQDHYQVLEKHYAIPAIRLFLRSCFFHLTYKQITN